MDRKDWLVTALLFSCVMLLGVSQLQKPILSDPVGYARLAVSITEGSYSIDGAPETFRPPVFPLAIAPLVIALGNALWATRIAAALGLALLACVVYVIARKRLDPLLSLFAAALVVFNPWVVYYTLLLPFSESIAVLLLVLGMFLAFREDSGWQRYLGIILISASLLTRTAFLLIVAPFALFWALHIVRKKGYRELFLIALIFVPFLIWSIRSSLMPVDNVYLASAADRWVHAPTSAAKLFLISMPLAFLALIPLAFMADWSFLMRRIKDAIRTKGKSPLGFGVSMLVALACYSFLLTILTHTESGMLEWAIGKTRLFYPFIPFLTILMISRSRLRRKTLLGVCSISLAAYFIASFALLTGFPGGASYYARADDRADAIAWVNSAAPDGSRVFIDFHDQMVDANTLNRDLLRKDLVLASDESAADFIVTDAPGNPLGGEFGTVAVINSMP